MPKPAVRDAGGVERLVFAVGVIGDQDLHGTEPAFASVEKSRDRGRVREVRLEAGGPAARRRDPVDDPLGRLLPEGLVEIQSAGPGLQGRGLSLRADRGGAAVGRNEYAGPLGGQGLGDGRADAVVRSRDQRDAAGQACFDHIDPSRGADIRA